MRRSYEQQEYYEWPASYSNVVNDIKEEYNCKVIVFDNKFLMMMMMMKFNFQSAKPGSFLLNNLLFCGLKGTQD